MKFLTPAFAGLLVLLVAGLLVAGYVAKTLFAKEEVVQEDPTQLVPMALAAIEPGTVITEAHIGRGPIRRSALNDLPRTTARADRVLLGRIVKNRIEPASPIDTTDLYAPGERPPVNLAPGMRAVSINVNGGAQLLDKVIQDGDYVDVHFTPSVTDERARGGFTMRLFEGVRLIDHASSRGAATVTLEVSPEQANILILARDRGQLQLAYTQSGPGNGTIAVANEDRAYLEEILGLKPLEEPERFQTEQVFGTAYGVLQFEDGKRSDVTGGYYGRGRGGSNLRNWRIPPAPGRGFNGYGGGYGRGYGANTPQTAPGRATPFATANRNAAGSNVPEVPNAAPQTFPTAF